MYSCHAEAGNDMKIQYEHEDCSRSVNALKRHAAAGRFPLYVRDYAAMEKWAVFDRLTWRIMGGEILASIEASSDWQWSPDQRLMFG